MNGIGGFGFVGGFGQLGNVGSLGSCGSLYSSGRPISSPFGGFFGAFGNFQTSSLGYSGLGSCGGYPQHNRFGQCQNFLGGNFQGCSPAYNGVNGCALGGFVQVNEQKEKMWDVWFDHAACPTMGAHEYNGAIRRSPIVLDLNKNGAPDITGANITGNGKIDGETVLFDIDPTKSAAPGQKWQVKSKDRRPGKGAPLVVGAKWEGNKYMGPSGRVLGEKKGNFYYYNDTAGKTTRYGARRVVKESEIMDQPTRKAGDPREKTEWLAKNGGDGLLVWDFNNDGKISSSKELMSEFDKEGKKAFANGYEKLAHYFDKDKDGVVRGDELKGLQIWKDTNADGKVDKGELQSLKEHGYTSFDVSNYNSETMEGIAGRGYNANFGLFGGFAGMNPGFGQGMSYCQGSYPSFGGGYNPYAGGGFSAGFGSGFNYQPNQGFIGSCGGFGGYW